MTESPPEPLPTFTPVPLARARHDGWTPERQAGFIRQLTRIGLVSAAAKSVGMSAKSAYALRKRAGAESFARAWDDALGVGCLITESIAIDRALHGMVIPIFYRGRQVGQRVTYDNRLLLAALRRHHPAARGGDVP